MGQERYSSLDVDNLKGVVVSQLLSALSVVEKIVLVLGGSVCLYMGIKDRAFSSGWLSVCQ